MAEYIEREAVLKQMMFEMCGTGVQHKAMDVIRYAPTADVVEVVRCKECDYAQICPDGLYWCYKHDSVVREDDFCNYGERSEE